MTTDISINTCQKICIQVTATNTATPYTWTPSNSNIIVTTGGNGLSAIVCGSFEGSASLTVKDTNGGVVSFFYFTVLSLAAYAPPSGSNTVLLGSRVNTIGTPPNVTTATATGNFSILSSGFGANNYIWIAFHMSTVSNFGYNIINSTWDRSSNTMVFNKPSAATVPLIIYAIVGIGISSTSPTEATMDYAIPVVQYIPLTAQTSAFSTVITLPYQLPCADLTQYIVFAQAGPVASPNIVQCATLLSANQIKVGWQTALTNYSLSYMVLATGMQNSSIVDYSTILTGVSILNGSTTQTFTVPTTLNSQSAYFGIIKPTSISDVATFGVYVTQVHWTAGPTTLNLEVDFQNNTGGTVVTNVAVFSVVNAFSAITWSIP